MAVRSDSHSISLVRSGATINTARMVSADPGRAPRLPVAAVSAWSGVSVEILGTWIQVGALPPARGLGWAGETRDRVVALRDLVLGMGVPVADALVMLSGGDRPD